MSKTLGIPKTSKASGKYWFFANSREMIGFIGADLVLSDEEWVAVQFDAADRVIFSEYNNKPTGCLSNGVCLFPGLFGTSPEQTVITAPSVEDAAAKSYRASDGECAVYLLLKPLPWPLKAGPLQYSVDGKTLGLVNDKSYLFLTHAPGDVRVSAYQFTISMKCKAGDELYVSATKARDWSWETGDELVPVDAAEGKAAIDLRRLALPD